MKKNHPIMIVKDGKNVVGFNLYHFIGGKYVHLVMSGGKYYVDGVLQEKE